MLQIACWASQHAVAGQFVLKLYLVEAGPSSWFAQRETNTSGILLLHRCPSVRPSVRPSVTVKLLRQNGRKGGGLLSNRSQYLQQTRHPINTAAAAVLGFRFRDG